MNTKRIQQRHDIHLEESTRARTIHPRTIIKSVSEGYPDRKTSEKGRRAQLQKCLENKKDNDTRPNLNTDKSFSQKIRRRRKYVFRLLEAPEDFLRLLKRRR